MTTPEELLRQKSEIQRVFEQQRVHQYVVARSSSRERIAKLRLLHDTVLRYRKEIETAMWQDLRKSPTEVTITEIGIINVEIRHTISHLSSWMTPRKVNTPLALIGTASEIRYEPKGVCLIISPWNYPFNLTFAPLASAIAAGNCVILKPSEFTPNSSALMAKIVAECFPREEVALFEGDASVSQALLALPFNHIFFTGSPAVGKIVMRAAADHLSSVTLELGGKSPVVVDETADLDTAAAKIAWLKCMNAGQICIAPDYVLVHESVHDALVAKIAQKIESFYGNSPEARRESPDLCRIVHDRHFLRVKALLDDAVQQGAQIAFGGATDQASCYIEPTILTRVPASAHIWEEEIFGTLLLVHPYRTLEEAIDLINRKPQSLAMYLFSGKNAHIEQVLRDTRNGDVTVNDCAVHFANPELPFGGVNNSGIGKSHGEFGFLEFSNARGVLRQNRIFPHTNMFLPPYGKHNGLVKLMLEGLAKWF